MAGIALKSSVAPGVLATVVLAACSPGTPDGLSLDIDLVEYAAFQSEQVDTALVDSRWRPDPDLEPGWSVGRVRGTSEPALLLVESEALLSFFATEVADRTLEIEAALADDDDDLRLGLMVNGHRLQAVLPRSGRRVYSIPLPAAVLRQGRNLLRLQPRSASLIAADPEAAFFGIHTLRWLGVDGAPVREGDPAATIRSSPPERTGAARRIESPAGSYFDVVARAPRDARLRSVLRVAVTPGPGDPTARVEISLLDEGGELRALYAAEFGPADRAATGLDLDLDTPEGELIRLRFAVRSNAEAIARWQGPGIYAHSRPVTSTPSAPDATAGLRPDILVVLLDAARADAFSAYGGPYPTPTLDRLAAEGTLFERALSPSSWTGQSVPAILTGRGPNALGIGHWGDRVPSTVPTLAELLARAGYRTTLWSQHPFYRWHSDLQRGFSTVRVVGSGAFDGAELARHLVAEKRPWMTFLHLLPPHAPYSPPKPFRGSRTAWYRGQIEPAAEFLDAISAGRIEDGPGPEDLRYIRDRYLEHVEYADALVGRLVSELEDAGRYDDTLIVVLADHGEGFLEHDLFLHTRELYDEFVWVPLVVKWPRALDGPGPSVGATVSLLDLVPTLVDTLKLESLAALPGTSLLRSDLAPRPVHTTTRGDSSRDRRAQASLAVELEGWKAIYRPRTDSTELYALEVDPGERRDRALDSPLVAELLRQEILRRLWLDAQFARSGPSLEPVPELDPREIEELEALGYLN